MKSTLFIALVLFFSGLTKNVSAQYRNPDPHNPRVDCRYWWTECNMKKRYHRTPREGNVNNPKINGDRAYEHRVLKTTHDLNNPFGTALQLRVGYTELRAMDLQFHSLDIGGRINMAFNETHYLGFGYSAQVSASDGYVGDLIRVNWGYVVSRDKDLAGALEIGMTALRLREFEELGVPVCLGAMFGGGYHAIYANRWVIGLDANLGQSWVKSRSKDSYTTLAHSVTISFGVQL